MSILRVLNKNNEIEEISQSEEIFNNAITSYVRENCERLAETPEYKNYEIAYKGRAICRQLKLAAAKGETTFSKIMEENDKIINANLNEEVKRYAFVEEVGQSFKTPLGKLALGLLIPAFMFWGFTKMTTHNAEATETFDVGTVMQQQQASVTDAEQPVAASLPSSPKS